MPDVAQITSYARMLQLTPVDGFTAPLPLQANVEAAAAEGRRPRTRVVPLSFWLVVVAPTLLAALYFLFFAADRYQSEARFVLRVPGQTMMQSGAMAQVMQATGVSRASEDGHVVREFLESRTAMKWLADHNALKAIFAKASWDPFWRYPSLFSSNTNEGLFRYFQRMVSANFDSSTGLNILKVEAFTPKDAQVIADSLLGAAEALVNRLNERARQDAINVAEKEEDRMRQRTLAAQAAMTAFREKERLIDPSQATLALLETIARLAIESAQISVRISELRQSSPNSPQIGTLNSRRVALESEIAKERHRLAGDSRSVAPRIAEYERLMLEREFAEKALMTAMAGVEMARVEAMRQQIYLERVAAPTAPDYPAYPYRVVYIVAVLLIGLMAWRIWRLLSADSRRHHSA
jgi:capsular polysaccharide transport system permease protein